MELMDEITMYYYFGQDVPSASSWYNLGVLKH